jgi:hypothetical protein
VWLRVSGLCWRVIKGTLTKSPSTDCYHCTFITLE